MTLELTEAEIDRYVKIWTEVLENLPPTNVNDLYKDHKDIVEALGDNTGQIFDAHEHLGIPERSEAIKNLPKWLDEYEVEHSNVEVKEAEFGYGLFATKDIALHEPAVKVPRKATISLEYGEEKTVIRKMHKNDDILKSMPNVTVAIILAEVLLSKDKRFLPYARALPSVHDTLIFMTTDQLLQLKPSPTFEAALLMYRSVARHYVYFLLRIVRDSVFDEKSKFVFKNCALNSEKFTFNFYKWCVSNSSTRMNGVPRRQGTLQNQRPLPTLVPLIDFCNFMQEDENNVSQYYDFDTRTVQLRANRDIKAGEELTLYYGHRSNSEFLLHNGLVPSTHNPHNYYELKTGFPINKFVEEKCSYLQSMNMLPERGVYHFKLRRSQLEYREPIDYSRLPIFTFCKVFVIDELQKVDERETKEKARKFLVQRLQLYKATYGELKEPGDGSRFDRYVYEIKKDEVDLLNKFIQKYEELTFS
ncbi:unnamed protein product [Bursaphelenchus okinawaensis]|uniref:protein-histidine N-methyltransferase n=1 Tax=Bursaphelenchus okinawaensis TaxID=465554 RepID=A0A811LM86_9BILA|nr:unnamed protein product [Bursaphelenchus okinawaensis]CAG9127022.1 unnamed protein product [Bursaphelenchus okinawaensis]